MEGNQFSMVQYSLDIQCIENILVFLNIQYEVQSVRWWYGCLEVCARIMVSKTSSCRIMPSLEIFRK